MEARIERVASPGDADTPESNAWIVGDDDEVIVVDPGRDAGAVLSAVGDREILAVICTHGHAAHVAAAPAVAARDEAPVALNPRDRLPWAGGPPGRRPGDRYGGRRDLRGRGRLAGSHPRPRAHPGLGMPVQRGTRSG